MAHMVETMAYAGEVPWHGLGKRVLPDLTPEQMLVEAGLDWEVKKVPTYCYIAEKGKPPKKVPTNSSALVRMSDHRVLDTISDDWKPLQNRDAFEFFNDFVAAGDMEMHTAGSLRDGNIVWALAKVKDSFALSGGKDQVDSYLLFTLPHQYGKSIDVRFTPIRVVCNNTLTLSLAKKGDMMFRHGHRTEFNPERAKEALGIAHSKMEEYKTLGQFLSTKRYSDENVIEYFKRVFPVSASGVEESERRRKAKEISLNAQKALEVVETQPGAELAPDTWWNAFNAVTFLADHVLGRNADNRLTSSWYGINRQLKTSALELAAEYANAA